MPNVPPLGIRGTKATRKSNETMSLGLDKICLGKRANCIRKRCAKIEACKEVHQVIPEVCSGGGGSLSGYDSQKLLAHIRGCVGITSG